jgi:hypothetical protein
VLLSKLVAFALGRAPKPAQVPNWQLLSRFQLGKEEG